MATTNEGAVLRLILALLRELPRDVRREVVRIVADTVGVQTR